MNLLTINGKLKKTNLENMSRVMSFSIPAYKGINGKTTCPFAKDCVKYCYAKRGNYRFDSVKKGLQKRFELTKKEEFITIMQAELFMQRPTHVRIHSAGDFYSPEYIQKWVTLAKQNKNIVFYAYTKSVPLFKGLKLPKNFITIYSFGSKRDDLINTKTDRHSKIFKSHEEMKKAGYIDASDNDLNAISRSKKIGLMYH